MWKQGWTNENGKRWQGIRTPNSKEKVMYRASIYGKRWQRKQIIAYGKRRLKRWVIVHGKKWWREQANAKRKKHQGGWISTSGKRRMHCYLKNKTIGGQKTIGKIKMTRKAKWEGAQTTTRRGFARGNGP